MEEIEMKEIITFYKKYMWIITIFVIGLSLIGFTYGITKREKMYRADVSLITLKDINNSNGADENLTINTDMIDTYLEIIKSKLVLENVIKEQKLNISYKELKNSISVSTKENTGIINLTVTTHNRNVVSIANKISKYFSDNITSLTKNKNIKILILDSATDYKEFYNISIKKITIIFFIIGLISSSGIVFIMFYFDNKVRNRNSIKRILDYDIVNNISETINIEEIRYYLENSKKILITSLNKDDDISNIAYKISKLYSENKKVLLVNISKYILNNIKEKESIKNNYKNLNIKTTNINNLYYLKLNNININTELFDKTLKNFENIIFITNSINETFLPIRIESIIDKILLIATINYTKLNDLICAKEKLENISQDKINIMINKREDV